MLHYILKLAFRTLKRNKITFFINLIGLSTGLASSILILLWVQNELSYDRFHENFKTIYRITSEVRAEKGISSAYPLAGAISEEIPQVKSAVRIRSTSGSETLFQVGNHKFDETSVLFADSNFFKVFTFPLVKGSPETALIRPDGLVLTERMAVKYFGSENPMGKEIHVDDDHLFTVAGVIENVPGNSHLQFDILLPMSYRARTDETIIKNLWDNFDFYTYVELDPTFSDGDIVAIQSKMDAIFKKNTSSFEAAFELQRLDRIHLYSKFRYDVVGQGSIRYVQIFSIATAFILCLACINFMNLATAISVRRSKEVGMRKAVGAERSSLMYQFMAETILITFFAMILAMVFVVFMLPTFNEVSGENLVISFDNHFLLAGLLIMVIITSLASGLYPAYFLSSLQAVTALKGRASGIKKSGILFRNVLVVLQFVVSIVMMACTIIIYDQLHFIENRKLGYDKENLLYIPLKGDLTENVRVLRAALNNAANLNNYSVVSELPTDLEAATRGVIWEGKDPEVWLPFSIMGVDENSYDIFKMKLVSGRSFSKEFKGDTINYVVNEKALQTMGIDLDSAVGQPLAVFGVQGSIIGVVEDFNFKPVHQAVDPIILRINPRYGYAVVRTQPARVVESIAELEKIWGQLNPSYHFEYGFVDQDLEKLYQLEYRMGTLFNAFAILAICISCLGLSGLAVFTSEQRTKEIGIRKALGATVLSILALLSKDFVRLMIVAFVIATPIAWYGMNQWLEAYEYRVAMEWWTFLVAGGAALFIAVFVVSCQSLKSALMSPVNSLRVE
ncbi:MAG TPA: ABC transporter permease [Chryseolinea sp.]|nr:ABC transporter permease [Chryseolinea sp.]